MENNNEHNYIEDEKELIYDKNAKLQDFDKLFEEDNDEQMIYEIDFSIKDRQTGSDVQVKVELEKLSYEKPMLGGYVNKSSGVYFFHAYGQTDQYKNPQVIKCERDAQTYYYKSRSTITKREFGTQMERVGLHIDIRQDKILYAEEYFGCQKWEQEREKTVSFLQKYVRGYLSRRLAREYKKEEREEKMILEQKEENERVKEEKKNKKEIERRTHPKTKEDFFLLRKELNMWVNQETERIKNSKLSDKDKTLALQELLHKEISLLETIEKLKISAKKENNSEKIEQFLAKMSADKKYKRHDGHIIEVSTVYTRTAGKLEEQFKNLNSSTSVDIRLKNLLEFKQLMEKYYSYKPCSLIQEIIALIEREADMLTRGRPDSSLEGLRQRLNNLYLNFIEIPIFNYEAADYQKIPRSWLMDLYKQKK